MTRQLNVVIVQQGEDVPSDPGYAPLRYGRLGTLLTERGHDVTRISPSFSHFRREQRPSGEQYSEEGRHVILPTGSYGASISKGRAQFTAQFLGGIRGYLKEHKDRLNVAILGVPPPGVVSSARTALGPRFPILADVRDLWPDAFAVGPREKWAPVATRAGRVFSQELRLATTVTAVTKPMLDWAPKGKRFDVIPIGMSQRDLDPALLPPVEAPLQVCFVSSHSHGFDFLPVLKGWRRYVQDLGDSGHAGRPRFVFVGASPSDEGAQEAADVDPTVEQPGRIPADQVGPTLNGIDIGLYPSRDSWSYSLGNKVFDYLSSGLYLVHSIEPEVAETLDANDLGQRCEPTSDAWHAAFTDLHARREQLRLQRKARIDAADALFGAGATTTRLADLLESIAR
ncbi:MAG: hypothetical protein AAF467_04560 [Actinomycetota bacterium]